MLLWLSPALAHAQDLQVAAPVLDLRAYSGTSLCKLPKGARVTPSGPSIGTWVPVKIDHPGCPAEGYVDAEFMEPAAARAPEPKREPAPRSEIAPPPDTSEKPASRPGAALVSFEGTKLCDIPPGTNLSRSGKKIGDWVLVRLNAPGCPAEGYVDANLFGASGALEGREAAPPSPSPPPLVERREDPPATERQGVTVELAPASPPRQETVTLPETAPLPVPNPIRAEERARTVRVTARGLNVRTATGEILCAVPRNTALIATGRHADGERIKVKIDHPGCPKEGYVSSTYVRPESGGKLALDSEVKVNGLSLRSEPRLSDSSWVCALPKNQRVVIIPGETEFRNNVSWVKVRVVNPPPGCPDTGY